MKSIVPLSLSPIHAVSDDTNRQGGGCSAVCGSQDTAKTQGVSTRQGTPRLLSTAQAGDYLGVSADTIRKYRDEGKIPAFLVGERLVKYAPEDLDRFLREFNS